jgi:hypothetical protein
MYKLGYKLPLVLLACLLVSLCSCGGNNASATRAANPPSVPETRGVPTPANTGTITGELGFPGEYVPALIIAAIPVQGGGTYLMDTKDGDITFNMIDIAPGQYFIVAYQRETPSFAGGYTKFALTSMSVNDPQDHSLIPVTVETGKTASGVRIRDWYAPEGTFPPLPNPPKGAQTH